MEKISVLVPIYNSEKYLNRCIESILNQTYANIEIVLIDDESTDNSYNIIKNYETIDERVKVIQIKNNGVADARNKAIDNATGKYITFVDSDDYIEKDYIETLYNNLIKYNADISVCNCINKIEESGKEIYKDFGINSIKEYSSEEAVESLFYYNFLRHSPWGKLYKREVWNNIRFPIGKNYEDLAILYKTFLNANKIIYIPEEKYNYIIRKGSIVHNDIRKSDIEAIIEYCQDILGDITCNYPSLKNAAEFLLADHELHLWYRIPDKKEYKEYIKIAVINVKKYRISILKNKKVSKKNKILFLLSYLGRKPYRKIIEVKKKYSI